MNEQVGVSIAILITAIAVSVYSFYRFLNEKPNDDNDDTE